MSLSLRQLADRFFAYIAQHNAPGTCYYYRLHVNRFVAQVGDIQVSDIRKYHLLEWGRCWHSIQAVQRLFNWACAEMELIERNPFASVKRPRPGRRRRVLQRAEILRALRAAAPDFRAVLVAMCETIARPQEVRKLLWAQLRWDEATHTMTQALIAGDARFELHDYKARERRADPEEPRLIFVTPRLGRLLARVLQRGANVAGHVFVNHAGRPFSKDAIVTRVRRLRRRAGIAADARGERFVAYNLRHTAATNATINGVPDRVLAGIMGHTSTRTTARYQHPSVQHLRDALRKLRKDRPS